MCGAFIRHALVLAAAIVAALASPAAGQTIAAAPASATSPKSVDVPRGDGSPVITDGIFSPGEWDDALAVAVADGVTLYFKEYGGVAFIGVRGKTLNAPGPTLPPIGPTEISLATPGGPIVKLHVSFALYEVVVPAAGPEPEPRLGLTSGWYASELRRDEHLSERLRKEGKPPLEVMGASAYPSDGIEFAIRRSKLPGRTWRMRLWASAMVGGGPGTVTFPTGAADRETDGWLELRFAQDR